jgi:hypothetical protein
LNYDTCGSIRYEKVEYLEGRRKDIPTKRHYGLTDKNEYFAECSEAYFSSTRFKNDYYPYNKDQLREFDPAGYAMCEQVWGLAEKCGKKGSTGQVRGAAERGMR